MDGWMDKPGEGWGFQTVRGGGILMVEICAPVLAPSGLSWSQSPHL